MGKMQPCTAAKNNQFWGNVGELRKMPFSQIVKALAGPIQALAVRAKYD